MSEADMTEIKPESMKSYLWLKTADDSIQQVEQEVAMFCPMICQEVITKGMGSSKTYPISLPPRVTPAMLSLILDYCRFHQAPGRSNKERKSFDEKFIRMDTKRLCELTSAADCLQLKPLVDLTSRALARMIEGKTPEEIRDIFHLPDDLTEEEKLEPLKNITDDPRIRLLNRLYARKRKELKEKDKLKNVGTGEERVDDRSVDDLLSFINGGNQGTKSSKNKKKNKRKDHLRIGPSISDKSDLKEKTNGVHSLCDDAVRDQQNSPGDINNSDRSSLVNSGTDFASTRTDIDILALKTELDIGDIEDDIDPELKEKVDREVEDFARRLNSDWPERIQEILCLGQESRAAPVSANGNGILRK